MDGRILEQSTLSLF